MATPRSTGFGQRCQRKPF
ncbi:hypothetical protein CGLO_10699 [Colletotrichum gloeosporioides Cg-14]|uniref:Uncharacterized protein n=1 Tax=Colletotrichum gloeosporioides (strain Cg-14) TaxID=1237896 RepID=T0KA42_COLGC|nr:hypothetical protein CGLO_10699 [Colletotrichum gloeosporioides Cg-14]